MDRNDKLQLRNNEQHDELVAIYQINERELATFIQQGNRGRDKLEEKHKLDAKGIRGPCALRPLAYFDVGSCFLIDSLHNVYLGAFVSIFFHFQSNIKQKFVVASLVELMVGCCLSQ